MAQRKSPASGKSSGSSRPGGKPGSAGSKPATKAATKPASPAKSTAKASSDANPSLTKSSAARSGARNTTGPATRPPARRKTKSIVNQKQTPWGLIATTIAVVLFAAAVIVVVIVTHKSSNGTDAADPYRQPEIAAAKKIQGVTYRVEPNHNHVPGNVKYNATPPVGGNHNGFWADCNGTVYPKPIASENAVHMLEHGAVWVTYNASEVTGKQLTELKSYVSGQGYTALSPYPNLDTPISLQAWGYQLKLKSASDPRIAQFIATLKQNKAATPEQGASCTNAGFKQNPSTFGHPSSG